MRTPQALLARSTGLAVALAGQVGQGLRPVGALHSAEGAREPRGAATSWGVLPPRLVLRGGDLSLAGSRRGARSACMALAAHGQRWLDCRWGWLGCRSGCLGHEHMDCRPGWAGGVNTGCRLGWWEGRPGWAGRGWSDCRLGWSDCSSGCWGRAHMDCIQG